MKATFIVTVEIDAGLIGLHAHHRRKPLDVAQRECLALLECRLSDSIRHCDGVQPPISIATEVMDALSERPA
jgi:hypothetical protein